MSSSDNDEHTAKRQCLSSVKSEVYHHHPLFTEVITTAENEELVTLHVLNNDTLDMILSYLHVVELFRMSLVCRRWYNLCLQKISRISCFSVFCNLKYIKGSIVRNNEFYYLKVNSLLKAHQMESVVSALSLNCGSLTTLSLYRVVGMKADHLSYLSDHLPNLMNLKLAEKLLSDVTILAVIREIAPRLVSLCIILSGVVYQDNKAAMNNVLMNTKQLAHLTIHQNLGSESPNWNWQTILPDKISLTNPLKSVEITNTTKLNTSLVQFIMRNFASTLEYLNLSGTYPVSDSVVAMDYRLPALHNMKVFLSYSNLKRVTSERNVSHSAFMISILKLMPNVKVIDLSGNYHFSENDFDIVDILSRHCLLLEELHLSNCWIPAEKLENLKTLKCLKRLCLDGLPKDWENDNQRSNNARRLIETFPEHNPALSFRCVASNLLPHLETLEYLSMCNVNFDKDDLALLIGNAGPNFKTLVMSATLRSAGDKKLYNEYKDNPFEGALKECNSVVREEPLTLIIMLSRYHTLHIESCDVELRRCRCHKDRLPLYNEISPNYLQVVDSDVCKNLKKHFVSLNGRLSRSYGKNIEFPFFDVLGVDDILRNHFLKHHCK